MNGEGIASPAGGAAGDSSPPAVLTTDQVQRWARMVADGRAELSDGLAADDRQLVEAGVRRLLRQRLLRLIAQAITADIARGQDRAGGKDDPTQIQPEQPLPNRQVRADE